MRNLINQGVNLLFSPTAKNIGITFVGNSVASVLGIFFALIAAYHLATESWGIVASVRNLINILIAVADLGLGAALFQHASGKWKQDPKKTYEVYKEIFSLRIISGLLFSFVLIVFSGIISKVAFGFTDNTLIYLTALGFVGVLLLDFQIFAVQSKQSWVSASFLISLTNVLRVVFLLSLVWAGKVNQFNVLLFFSLSGVFAFLASWIIIPAVPVLKFNFKEVFKQFGSFSLWMSTNKIVSTIASRIDILLVLQTLGAHKAGIYGVASTLAVGVPLIIGSYATIFASKFASIREKEELKDFFNKSIGLSVLICLLLVVGILISPFVIGFFGPRYQQATSVLQWLFVGMMPLVLSAPAVNILIYYFKKPEIIASLSVLQLFIILGLNFYYLPTLDIYAPVLAQGLSNLSTMIISYFFAYKYLKNL